MTYYTYHNPQNGDSRWQKPTGPAAGKTPFDCCGKSSASNGATSSGPRSEHVQAEFFNSKGNASAGFPFSSQSEPASLGTSMAKILGGGALALIGLPMLILPGPGLLCLGGGIALAASGLNDLRNAVSI